MTDLQLGAAVWMIAAGITVAGRVIGAGPLHDGDENRVVIDQNTLGQHLPQWYRPAEIAVLTAGLAPQLGLCPDCLGYGTIGELGDADTYYPYSVDEVPDPCGECGGSGRRYVRVTVERSDGQVTGRMELVPHDPVYGSGLTAVKGVRGMLRSAPLGPPAPDMCLACGVTQDAHPTPPAPTEGGLKPDAVTTSRSQRGTAHQPLRR